MPDTLLRNSAPSIDDIRQSLKRVRMNMEAYASADLLALRHAAETTAHMIRLELVARDTRVVDEACNAKETA